MNLTTYWGHPILGTLFDDNFKTEDKEFFSRTFSPKANIFEDEKNYHLDIELPGVKKEEIEVTVKDNILVVSGEKKRQVKGKDDDYSFIESYYGTFKRQWKVADVEEGKIDANFKGGILKITLPKKEEVIEQKKIKKITVN